MNSNKTALEWYLEKRDKILITSYAPDGDGWIQLHRDLKKLEKDALEMERQQIEKAYCEGDGFHDEKTPYMAREYYNQTYGMETIK